MIKMKRLKTRNATKVTFEVPAEVAGDADAVQLLAEFNDWQAVPFEKKKRGAWKLVQEVEPGRRYQFRYRIERGGAVDYVNDADADGVVPNDQGTENAVLRS